MAQPEERKARQQVRARQQQHWNQKAEVGLAQAASLESAKPKTGPAAEAPSNKPKTSPGVA